MKPITMQATLLTANRTVMNTGFRMVYPLMPVLARGLGVEITAIAAIVTWTQLVGLGAPLMGELAERRSKRFNIALGMACNAVGLGLVFVVPGYNGLALALILAALGKNALYDPAAQAYIGDRVPYRRRGLIMGIMELSWSLAFLVGVPLMTLLINQNGWRAPFGVLAALCALGFLGALALLDEDESNTKSGQPLLRNLQLAISTRVGVAGLVLGFSISSANQLISVVFGTWIEGAFGIALSALAAASAVIGISELFGEGVVAGFADRFGKRRVVATGIVINIIACLALPYATASLTVALGGLFVFYLGFEIAIVATLPLASELTPQTRAMYMTLLVVSFTVGRAVITQPGVLLFEAFGMGANTALAIGFNVLALVAVLWGIRLEG